MKEQQNLGLKKIAYSLDEAAEMLGVSKGHLRNESRRGRLTLHKTGTRTIVLSTSLDDYLSRLLRASVNAETNEGAA